VADGEKPVFVKEVTDFFRIYGKGGTFDLALPRASISSYTEKRGLFIMPIFMTLSPEE